MIFKAKNAYCIMCKALGRTTNATVLRTVRKKVYPLCNSCAEHFDRHTPEK